MNGQPAFASQFVGEAFERPGRLLVLTLAPGRLSGMTQFLRDV